MRKPIVGVIGSAHSIHDILNIQHVCVHSLLCISEVADALPLMFAGCPGITDIDALLNTVDGVLLTGARANVHPSCFGVDPDVRYEPYDRDRDALARISQTSTGIACRYSTFESEINVLQPFDLQSKEDSLF